MNCGSTPISFQREGINWDYVIIERTYPADNEVIEKICAAKEIIKTYKSKNICLVVISPPNYQTHSKSFENRIN